jgi:hypothetical protein
VRLAITGVGGPYRGPVFMDSDIYKTLEAVSLAARPGPALAEFTAETTALPVGVFVMRNTFLQVPANWSTPPGSTARPLTYHHFRSPERPIYTVLCVTKR